MPMYCSNCGYDVGNASNFCPVCGKPVQKIDINLNKENTQHEFTQENDTSLENEGTEKHTIFILILIKREKSIRVFMILVDFLLGEI